MYALSSYYEFGKVSQALPDIGLALLDLGTYSVSGAYDVEFGQAASMEGKGIEGGTERYRGYRSTCRAFMERHEGVQRNTLWYAQVHGGTGKYKRVHREIQKGAHKVQETYTGAQEEYGGVRGTWSVLAYHYIEHVTMHSKASEQGRTQGGVVGVAA